VLLFLDRERRGEAYPWLQWKVRLFAIGAGLAIGGIILDWRWLIVAAIVVLAAGFTLRFLPGGRGVVRDAPDGDEEENGRG
jgi:hypothetical protein